MLTEAQGMAGSRPLFLVQIHADPDPEMREWEGEIMSLCSRSRNHATINQPALTANAVNCLTNVRDHTSFKYPLAREPL